MSLTKKEVDDLKPLIDRVVQKVVGFSEPTLVTAAINCLDKGYNEKKTAGLYTNGVICVLCFKMSSFDLTKFIQKQC